MLGELRWLRIVLFSAGALVLTYAVVFAVIFGYAAWLGFQAQGPPDPDRISEFAQRIGPRLGRPAGFVLIVLAAWLGGRVESRRFEHGVAVGASAGLLGLTLNLIGGFEPYHLLSLLLDLVAGSAGGWLAYLGRKRVATSSP